MRVALTMFGGPFDNAKHRLNQRLQLLSAVSEQVILIIDGAPRGLAISDNIMLMDSRAMALSKFEELGKARDFSTSIWARVLSLLVCSRIIAATAKRVDVLIFVTGIPMILPLVIEGKLFRRHVVMLVGGSAALPFLANNPRKRLRGRIIRRLEIVCYHLADTLLAETWTAVEFMGLTSFADKVKLMKTLSFIDTTKFTVTCDIAKRPNIIGYVGHLARGKGVLEFVESIYFLAQKRDDVRAYIVGEGPLKETLLKKTKYLGIEGMVAFLGWVPYENMPAVLNKLRLLVVPSLTEGLPNVVLEAMACGTPVLASPVGGIPDVICDGVTGFLLEQNSPQAICDAILDALNCERLEDITARARDLVERDFSRNAAMKRWRKLLADASD